MGHCSRPRPIFNSDSIRTVCVCAPFLLCFATFSRTATLNRANRTCVQLYLSILLGNELSLACNTLKSSSEENLSIQSSRQ